MAIWIKAYGLNQLNIFDCICSGCGWKTGKQGIEFHYCPICGCKMENCIDTTEIITKAKIKAIIDDIEQEKICMAYNLNMSKEEIAHAALKSAKESILDSICKHLEDMDGEEDY